MENRQHLLPHWFKYLGCIISGMTPLLFVLSGKGVFTGLEPSIMRFLIFTIIVFGLSFITFARERIEDEMVISIRSKAIVFSFATTILYFSFLKPVGGLILYNKIEEVNSYEIISFMLLCYLGMFYFLRRKMK